jgi:hypothetical protein
MFGRALAAETATDVSAIAWGVSAPMTEGEWAASVGSAKAAGLAAAVGTSGEAMPGSEVAQVCLGHGFSLGSPLGWTVALCIWVNVGLVKGERLKAAGLAAAVGTSREAMPGGEVPQVRLGKGGMGQEGMGHRGVGKGGGASGGGWVLGGGDVG